MKKILVGVILSFFVSWAIYFFSGMYSEDKEQAKIEFDASMPIDIGWEGAKWGTHYDQIGELVNLSSLGKKSTDKNGMYTIKSWIHRSIVGIQAEGHPYFSRFDRLCRVVFIIKSYSLDGNGVEPIVKNFTQRFGAPEVVDNRYSWYYRQTSLDLIDGGSAGAGINVGGAFKCSKVAAEARFQELSRD